MIGATTKLLTNQCFHLWCGQKYKIDFVLVAINYKSRYRMGEILENNGSDRLATGSSHSAFLALKC